MSLFPYLILRTGAGILSFKGVFASFELREKPAPHEPLDPSIVPTRLVNHMACGDKTSTDPRHERYHPSPKHGMTLDDQ